jgi:amino acid permease
MTKPQLSVIIETPSFPTRSSSNPSFLSRSFGPLTPGGIRQSMFTLISAAIGGGILCLPYVMSQAGIVNGSLLLLFATLLAFVSMRMLLLSASRTGALSYGQLLSITSDSKYAAPFLDIVTILFGQGVIIAYFVFLGDFVPPVAAVLGGAPILVNRMACILICCVCAIPFAIPNKLSALQYITPISTLSLAITACVVVLRTDYMRSNASEYIPLDYAIFDWNLLKCFAIVISSFICHTNVVAVAGELVDPSERRSTKVALRAALVQLVLYLVISVCGYASFGRTIAQNFIKNYPEDDPLITVCRILLSLTIFFGLPINTNPTAKALVSLLSPGKRGPLIEPLLPPITPRTTDNYLRIGLGISVLITGAVVSLYVPGVADVISVLGGSLGTLIMLVFPAMIYKSIFKTELTLTDKVLVNMLLVSAAACFSSVVLTMFRVI